MSGGVEEGGDYEYCGGFAGGGELVGEALGGG